jgi:hypothetical protein
LRWDIDEVAGVWFIDGQYQTGVAGHDSRTVCPTVTTTYYLRIQRRDGSVVTTPLTITVTAAPPANNPNFRADAYSVNPGQCTTLRWEVQNVRAVYFWDNGNQQGVEGVDSRQVCPNSTTVYQLEVIGNDGSVSNYYVTITVGGGASAPSVNFYASNPNISQGSCTGLIWQVSGQFNSIVLIDSSSNSTTVVGPNGNISVCPRTSATYILRVTGTDGRLYDNTVNVNVFSGGPTPAP